MSNWSKHSWRIERTQRSTKALALGARNDLLDAIVNETLTPQFNTPTLMFHDTTDPLAPTDDSRTAAKAWKSAHLIETEGLGHQGALQSDAIHDKS